MAQFAPSNDKAANLKTVRERADKAKTAEGADILVLPELALTGLDDPASNAEEVAGPTLGGFVRIAMRLRMHMVAGFAEKDGDGFYNSAGPEGAGGAGPHLSQDAPLAARQGLGHARQ